MVMELLKVFYALDEPTTIAAAAETTKLVRTILTTKNWGTTSVGFDDGSVVSEYTYQVIGAFTAAGTYARNTAQPFVQDLTDGAGHGVLIATDSINIQMNSSGTSLTNVCRIKLLYRWKDVAIEEYVGIVQSQQ